MENAALAGGDGKGDGDHDLADPKARTFARDLDDGRTRLIVVISASTPEDRERISERGSLLIQAAMKDWGE